MAQEALLDMDFGELQELGDISLSTPTAKGSEETIKNQNEDGKEKQEEFDFDISKAFEEGGFSEEEGGQDSTTEEEEEEVDEHEKDKSDKKGSPDSSFKKEKKEIKDSGVPFTLVFARYQLEQGNLSDLNEEELKEIIEKDGEGEAMAHLFRKEVETNRDEILKQYEEDAAELREYIELKDAGVNTDAAKELISQKMQFEKISEDDVESDDNEGLRKAVLTRNYELTTRFTPQKIKKLVDNHISLGEDVEEAKEALVNIKEVHKQMIAEEKKRVEQEAKVYEEQNKAAIQSLKDKVQSLEEILPGQKLTKQAKSRIEEMLLKPVSQDKTGRPVNAIWQKRLTNPVEFDIKLAYLIHSGLFDGKMDKIVKASKTEAVKDLENFIRNNKSSGFGTKGKTVLSDEFDEGSKSNIDSMRGLI